MEYTDYKKWAEEEREWLDNFDQEIADENDKEYAPLLNDIRKLFKK